MCSVLPQDMAATTFTKEILLIFKGIGEPVQLPRWMAMVSCMNVFNLFHDVLNYLAMVQELVAVVT